MRVHFYHGGFKCHLQLFSPSSRMIINFFAIFFPSAHMQPRSSSSVISTLSRKSFLQSRLILIKREKTSVGIDGGQEEAVGERRWRGSLRA